MIDDAFQLFILNGSQAFGEQVARWLAIAPSPHEEREFEDGEHKARPLVSVRGNDVFVIHSLYGDPTQSANDKLCRLLFFIGALKDAACARVTAVVPYLAYARKDRKTRPRDPVTTRYVAALFEAVGADSVLTLDVHNLAAYQNAFRHGAEHLEAAKLLARHFVPLVGADPVAVVSPDAGGIKRAERFLQLLVQLLAQSSANPVSLAIAEKHRSGGVVSGDLLVGEVRGRVAIIVDDLISTGNTLARTARACRDAGAKSVFAAATHGLFTADANTILADTTLERIVVTDTVAPFRLHADAVKKKLVVLGSTALFADALDRMHSGASLTDLLEL